MTSAYKRPWGDYTIGEAWQIVMQWVSDRLGQVTTQPEWVRNQMQQSESLLVALEEAAQIEPSPEQPLEPLPDDLATRLEYTQAAIELLSRRVEHGFSQLEARLSTIAGTVVVPGDNWLDEVLGDSVGTIAEITEPPSPPPIAEVVAQAQPPTVNDFSPIKRLDQIPDDVPEAVRVQPTAKKPRYNARAQQVYNVLDRFYEQHPDGKQVEANDYVRRQTKKGFSTKLFKDYWKDRRARSH
jgi:hypothetical protein